MTLTAVDTSVVIPALLSWHPKHEPASSAVEREFRRDLLLVPVPVLIESYSVLTRMPAPHRLSPATAYAILSRSFMDAQISSFRSRGFWSFLEGLATQMIAGGATYDAIILEAARAGGAEVLLTFNARDFERLDVRSIEIVTPE